MLAMALAVCCNGKACFADLNQRYIYTTEWLVYNSDHIVVAEFEGDSVVENGRIKQVLKGDGKTIRWPLIQPEFHGYGTLAPPAGGRFRLLFVKDESTLLQSVQLDRQQQVDTPTFWDVLYGVDGDGRLILSQTELFRSIRDRMSEPFAPLLKLRNRPQGKHFAFVSGHTKRSGISAPRQFPLEFNRDTYVLLVVFDQDRRDRLVHLLENGNASERLDAIWGLAQHADRESRKAIRDAKDARDVETSFQRDGSGHMVRVGTDDVKDYATKVAAKLFDDG
jgi:hypothetical protein